MTRGIAYVERVEVGQDIYALRELADRESRKLKDLASILIRYGLLSLRKKQVESVSAMADALFEEEKCRDLKRLVPSKD
jgi:hypothetical protein